jgi:hypothetical protein
MNQIRQQILRYLLAMNASGFDSAVHASVAFFGVAGAHAAIDAIPALTVQQFVAVFLLAFGRAILAYLDAHPIAESFRLQPAQPGPGNGGSQAAPVAPAPIGPEKNPEPIKTT